MMAIVFINETEVSPARAQAAMRELRHRIVQYSRQASDLVFEIRGEASDHRRSDKQPIGARVAIEVSRPATKPTQPFTSSISFGPRKT